MPNYFTLEKRLSHYYNTLQKHTKIFLNESFKQRWRVKVDLSYSKKVNYCILSNP